jgi:hypothetical protein
LDPLNGKRAIGEATPTLMPMFLARNGATQLDAVARGGD